MNAIVIDQKRLVWRAVDTPSPGPGELRVRVAASAINRADLLQAAGHYPPPPGASTILGLECAGTVDALGPDVAGWQVGDRCCALLTGGGYAEQVVVPVGQVLPVPTGMSLINAAAVPEVFTTAWLNLRRSLALQPGERVVIHAGASGVGTAAIQLCKLWGNPCFVTVGSQEKLDACLALGASGGAIRHDGDWRAAVEAWAPDGVHAILDPVGASYLNDALTVLATGGRVCIIGLMGGRNAAVDLALVLRKRLTIVGSVLRTRDTDDKAELLRAVHSELWKPFERGVLHPVVADVIAMTDAEAGHQRLASNKVIGKIVLALQSPQNSA